MSLPPDRPAGRYVGRFAPSPTGPLHEGSLVAALASWLDARAHGGRWLVRIEDVDGPRCPPGADATILSQLAQARLLPDEPPVWQSRRGAAYGQALERLRAAGWAYPCGCSRKDILEAVAARGDQRERHGELVYPGTCRHGLRGKPARAWRLRSTAGRGAVDGIDGDVAVDAGVDIDPGPGRRAEIDADADFRIDWHDRRLGAQSQDLTAEVGDFVLKRADGLWAYQLAVVVDDGLQQVTDIVRGEDLADNTPRQIRLQQLLGLPRPRYLHTPLVLGENGEKLSKQNGARALDLRDPLAALRRAGTALGLPAFAAREASSTADWLAQATALWRAREVDRGSHDRR
ncbi:tRNA glutamyl-Q(34) synthetase GluQRS [Roseateles aquatilis]|uniref:Glutamyl-Q tRNA(Asp) synthetase n=1 Tax=Roseateles aquatilis TaxID=431061 RepID=A0A246JH56_9BURK|nr:tRNA glutamyl-Q(34) synthetase GluQRS [Roseateles aquatilis]OWQ91941.1 tRNA glutamyl-Q(34) synthetase GluQRS [Roseateles aquatilis]